MKRVRRNIRGERGFTLVELLSATAISAILIMSLNTVLYNAFNMRDRSYETAYNTSAQLYAVSVMKRDFKAMLPPGEGVAGDLVGEDVGGRGMPIAQIEFYAASGAFDSSQPWSDVQRVEYTLKEIPGLQQSGLEKDETLYLVRSVEQNLLAFSEEEAVYQPLLADVSGLMISYYDGDSWSDSWDSSELSEEEESELLPQAVRVQILITKPHDESAAETGQNQEQLERIEFIVPITVQAITQPEETDEEAEEPAANETPGGENNNNTNNNGGQNPGGGGR